MAKRRPGTFEERFLRELERQCNGQDTAISNKALREALGWQDARFDKTRSILMQKGTVRAAQGQGGKTKFSVFPPSAKHKAKSLKVFISYSHSDEAMKNALLLHLKPLERLKLIDNWSDRSIKPGDQIDTTISENMDAADIILILVSVDFINSRYCYEIELERALDRHKAGNARVIPIILRNCLWHHAPFGGLKALPKDGKAVASWQDADEAYTSIASEIYSLAVELLAKAA